MKTKLHLNKKITSLTLVALLSISYVPYVAMAGGAYAYPVEAYMSNTFFLPLAALILSIVFAAGVKFKQEREKQNASVLKSLRYGRLQCCQRKGFKPFTIV